VLNGTDLQRNCALIVSDILQLKVKELYFLFQTCVWFTIIKFLCCFVSVFLLREELNDADDGARICFSELQADVMKHEDQNFQVSLLEWIQQNLEQIEQ
jgi:hypothetical protein